MKLGKIWAIAWVCVMPALAFGQAALATKAAARPGQVKSSAAGKRLAAKASAVAPAVDEVAGVELTPEAMEVAGRVYVGLFPCELGASVAVARHDSQPGFFIVRIRKDTFNMRPVTSRTGAIRLEDARAGALWLQLGNKSMLMSQKLGQRLADECVSPEQAVVAEALKRNPAPSILEAASDAVTK